MERERLARAADRKLAALCKLTAARERGSRRGRRASSAPPSSANATSAPPSSSAVWSLPGLRPVRVVSFGAGVAPTTEPVTEAPAPEPLLPDFDLTLPTAEAPLNAPTVFLPLAVLLLMPADVLPALTRFTAVGAGLVFEAVFVGFPEFVLGTYASGKVTPSNAGYA
jgi:hypothetical protein